MRQSARTSDRLHQSTSAQRTHRCARSPYPAATRRQSLPTRQKDRARDPAQTVRDPSRASPPSAPSADSSRESAIPSAAYDAQPTSHSGRRSAHWLRDGCDTVAHTSSPTRSPCRSASVTRQKHRPLFPPLTQSRWVQPQPRAVSSALQRSLPKRQVPARQAVAEGYRLPACYVRSLRSMSVLPKLHMRETSCPCSFAALSFLQVVGKLSQLVRCATNCF